jgi:hypothetical protein
MEELTTEKIHELCKWKWYDYIRYYGFYIWWNWITDLKWKIPNTIQRAYRGWGHADTWDFDRYLANVIRDGIKHLKNCQHGIPTDIYEKYRNDVLLDQNEAEFLALKEWNEILDKIVYGFDCASLISGDSYLELSHEERNQAENAYYEGMDLFKEYFFNLWD